MSWQNLKEDFQNKASDLFTSFYFDPALFKSRKFWGKVLLLAILSGTIGYMIAPKILLEDVEYQEGDIIRTTIVINEDLLLPDEVSTRLKAEQLLKDQGLIFDFDPHLAGSVMERVHQVFNATRQSFAQITNRKLSQSNAIRQVALNYFHSQQTQAQAAQDITNLRSLRAVWKQRIQDLPNSGNLSPKDFSRKAKLDQDLQIVLKLNQDLTQKARIEQQDSAKYFKELKKLQQSAAKLRKELEQEKIAFSEEFLSQLKAEIKVDFLTKLNFPFYDKEIENELTTILSQLLSKKILLSKQQIPQIPGTQTNITLRDLANGESQKYEDLSAFPDVAQLRLELPMTLQKNFPQDGSGQKRNLLQHLAEGLLQPTVTLNKLEMETRKAKILNEMSPVYFSVKKGEIIARAGNRATPHQVELINGYYKMQYSLDQIPKFIGINLLVFLALLIIYLAFRNESQGKVNFTCLLLIGVSLTITLVLVKGGVILSEMLEMRYTNLDSQSFRYILPIALAPMLVGILLSFEAGLMTALLTSLFVSIMLQANLYYFFFSLLGSFIATLPLTRFVSRYSILLHGMKIASVNLPMVLLLYLIEQNKISGVLLYNLGAAALGGILAAIITGILLPFFESAFDITTNLKLLELSNLHHPALRKLIANAAGTFQHSVVVGNLAEAGAQRVGANPLLARVSAYYHDLGKGEDPEYFYENKPPNVRNPHDDLPPLESINIIVGHLRKGALLADQHRLGKAIKDIMLQHHGTTSQKYFIAKAREQAKTQGVLPPDEELFRYHGPKPQTFEAALVMLADVCEASTRSIEAPTREAISAMVNKVCWRLLEEGQLDESGLSLKQFKEIVDEYINLLCQVHHSRIAYPEQEKPSIPHLARATVQGNLL